MDAITDTITDVPQCSNCFYQRTNECHFSPPTPSLTSGSATWPAVAADDWCGSYRTLGSKVP